VFVYAQIVADTRRKEFALLRDIGGVCAYFLQDII